MSVVTFDTLKFVKTLEAAGVPPQQAEAISTAVKDSHDAAELATKGDLRDLETGLRHEISDLRKDTDTKFAELRGEMTLLKWMLGLVIAGIASLVLKAFF